MNRRIGFYPSSLLSNKKSDGDRHSNTSAVSKLILTVTSEGSIGCLISEVERIENSQ
jgi:hypothetical protein